LYVPPVGAASVLDSVLFVFRFFFLSFIYVLFSAYVLLFIKFRGIKMYIKTRWHSLWTHDRRISLNLGGLSGDFFVDGLFSPAAVTRWTAATWWREL